MDVDEMDCFEEVMMRSLLYVLDYSGLIHQVVLITSKNSFDLYVS